MSSNATTVSPGRGPIVSAQNVYKIGARRLRRPNLATPSPCLTNNASSFVGIEFNFAGGQDSAVLGGNNNHACEASSSIGGGLGNATGAITGPALDSFIGAGIYNSITGSEDFVGAGARNYAGGEGSFVGAGGTYILPGNIASGTDTFIGAGSGNQVSGLAGFIGAGGSVAGNQLTGTDSFIGAGDENNVAGTEAFVGAGDENNVAGTEAFVGAGQSNAIGASAPYSVIGGGALNAVTGNASAAVIGGGFRGNVSAMYATIGGGYGDVASGTYATVPGGYSNVASGIGSFAAGSHAQAVDIGSFVWSDYTVSAPVLASTAANQFLARASGGFKLFYQSASDERRYARAGLGCVVVAQRSSDEDRRRAPRRLRGARQHVENASLRDRLASLEKKVAALASEQSER